MRPTAFEIDQCGHVPRGPGHIRMDTYAYTHKHTQSDTGTDTNRETNTSIYTHARNKQVHGPLTRYVKLRVRMRRECRECFPRHRGKAIPPCITARASTSGFLWNRWGGGGGGGGGERSRHSWCMRNPQFYVSGKRPMASTSTRIKKHIRDQYVYAPSQWEMALHYNAASH